MKLLRTRSKEVPSYKSRTFPLSYLSFDCFPIASTTPVTFIPSTSRGNIVRRVFPPDVKTTQGVIVIREIHYLVHRESRSSLNFIALLFHTLKNFRIFLQKSSERSLYLDENTIRRLSSYSTAYLPRQYPPVYFENNVKQVTLHQFPLNLPFPVTVEYIQTHLYRTNYKI